MAEEDDKHSTRSLAPADKPPPDSPDWAEYRRRRVQEYHRELGRMVALPPNQAAALREIGDANRAFRDAFNDALYRVYWPHGEPLAQVLPERPQAPAQIVEPQVPAPVATSKTETPEQTEPAPEQQASEPQVPAPIESQAEASAPLAAKAETTPQPADAPTPSPKRKRKPGAGRHCLLASDKVEQGQAIVRAELIENPKLRTKTLEDLTAHFRPLLDLPQDRVKDKTLQRRIIRPALGTK